MGRDPAFLACGREPFTVTPSKHARALSLHNVLAREARFVKDPKSNIRDLDAEDVKNLPFVPVVFVFDDEGELNSKAAAGFADGALSVCRVASHGVKPVAFAIVALCPVPHDGKGLAP